MLEESFESNYDSISKLSATEGPNRNVLEPKFHAREQMLALQSAIMAAHAGKSEIRSQLQLARCQLFLGNNLIETEEVKDGFVALFRAFAIVCACIEGRIDKDPLKMVPTPIGEILSIEEFHPSARNEFSCVEEYISSLNMIGLHMCSADSEQKMNDALKILLLSEKCFKSWNSWFLERTDIKICDVPISEEGKFISEKVEISSKVDDYRKRFKMDTLYTSTLFFLAQAYSSIDVALASRYVHLTMVHQLETKAEFNKVSWAENALHLSGFYAGNSDYGYALHCLEAGKFMMPKGGESDETTGKVTWAFGRYHLGRLRFFSTKSDERGADQTGSWFVPFPLPICEIKTPPPILTFEDAREEFKQANFYLQETLKYFTFDNQCSDHIVILRDISDLYAALICYEKDVDRQIAMHGRRLALLERIPEELNPQAYLTTIRQLRYDIAEISNEILDLRLKQKKSAGELGKPISDRKFNELSDSVREKFESFVKLFGDGKQAEEVRVAVFRAKMRLCGLITKRFYTTSQEEVRGIGTAIDAYANVVKFADDNKMVNDVAEEYELAKQMHALLPGKQRALAQAISSQ